MEKDQWNSGTEASAYPAAGGGQPIPPPSYGSPPPPPPSMGYGCSPPGATVYITTCAPELGPHPVCMECPHCHQQIQTKLTFHEGGLTWLLCILMALFGFWICCCIPFCVNDCQDVEHRCAHCNAYIGLYKRL